MIVRNARRWPLLQLNFVGESTDEEIDEELRTLTDAESPQSPWVVLVDLRRGRMTPFVPRQIRDFVRWLDAAREPLRSCAGAAVIVPDDAHAAAAELLTGLSDEVGGWFTWQVFDRQEAATRWALDQLEARGRSVLLSAGSLG